MNIAAVGTGYVGLISGACLADVGNKVMCLDVEPQEIAMLKAGAIPIHEPGLSEIVNRNVAADRLHFTTEVEDAARFGSMKFIPVGTPPGEEGSADLQHVVAAARGIGRSMVDYKPVVNKSFVPVGTADKVRAAVAEGFDRRGVAISYSVVSNPEFLKEGSAVEDFMRPDRAIIGASDEQAVELMRNLYVPFNRNHERIVIMDERSAELTKYASNAMLATRISFMNELAKPAERLGADIEVIRQCIGSDPRIGYDFLYPGCAYAGSCIPKDVQALIRTARQDAGMQPQVLTAVQAANDSQRLMLANKVRQRFGSNLKGRHFALWGLAFKPNTDDMLEAPSRYIVKALLDAGATVTAYDPIAVEEARRVLRNLNRVNFAGSAMAELEGAEALLIATESKECCAVDFDAIAKALQQPVIFDGRNLYATRMLRERGIEYRAISQ